MATEMNLATEQYKRNISKKTGITKTLSHLNKFKWLYILMLPGLLYFIIFKYIPMFGLIIIFENYHPALGFLGSKWVGLKHFIRFFTEPDFTLLLKNTLLISTLNIIFYFPLPILLALLLNEVTSTSVKRIVQTVTYLPHFFSWVVIASLSYIFLTTEGGIINELLVRFGGEKINFLMEPKFFRPLIVLQQIWKDVGWGTIIYLSAICSIEVEMYEAARIDGASRFQQLRFITLPSITGTIVVLLVLRLGQILNTGFEQIFLQLSPTTREVGDVFDTFVYEIGLTGGQFSYASAVGFFKSFVGLLLVYTADKISKKLGQDGVF